MNKTNEERLGCEAYLYKETKCCLHPCSVLDCPEPICAKDFPGGMSAYIRYKLVVTVLKESHGLEDAAKKLGVSRYVVQSIMKKAIHVGVICQ